MGERMGLLFPSSLLLLAWLSGVEPTQVLIQTCQVTLQYTSTKGMHCIVGRAWASRKHRTWNLHRPNKAKREFHQRRYRTRMLVHQSMLHVGADDNLFWKCLHRIHTKDVCLVQENNTSVFLMRGDTFSLIAGIFTGGVRVYIGVLVALTACQQSLPFPMNGTTSLLQGC